MSHDMEPSLIILHGLDGFARLRYFEKYPDGFTYFRPISDGTINEMRQEAERIHSLNPGVGLTIYEATLKHGIERSF